MNKYEMIYESICDLYNEGILTEEEVNEVNDLAYEKYVEEKTRFEKEYKKNPEAIKKYLVDRRERLRQDKIELNKDKMELENIKHKAMESPIDKNADRQIRALDRMLMKNYHLSELDRADRIGARFNAKKTAGRDEHSDFGFKKTYNYGEELSRNPGLIKKIYDNKKKVSKSSVNPYRLSHLKNKYYMDNL